MKRFGNKKLISHHISPAEHSSNMTKSPVNLDSSYDTTNRPQQHQQQQQSSSQGAKSAPAVEKQLASDKSQFEPDQSSNSAKPKEDGRQNAGMSPQTKPKPRRPREVANPAENCTSCAVCGQMGNESFPPNSGPNCICNTCSARIQGALSEFKEQQEQQEQPGKCATQKRQTIAQACGYADNAAFNIIVLQDCENNQLIDQLATALTRVQNTNQVECRGNVYENTSVNESMNCQQQQQQQQQLQQQQAQQQPPQQWYPEPVTTFCYGGKPSPDRFEYDNQNAMNRPCCYESTAYSPNSYGTSYSTPRNSTMPCQGGRNDWGPDDGQNYAMLPNVAARRCPYADDGNNYSMQRNSNSRRNDSFPEDGNNFYMPRTSCGRRSDWSNDADDLDFYSMPRNSTGRCSDWSPDVESGGSFSMPRNSNPKRKDCCPDAAEDNDCPMKWSPTARRIGSCPCANQSCGISGENLAVIIARVLELLLRSNQQVMEEGKKKKGGRKAAKAKGSSTSTGSAKKGQNRKSKQDDNDKFYLPIAGCCCTANYSNNNNNSNYNNNKGNGFTRYSKQQQQRGSSRSAGAPCARYSAQQRADSRPGSASSARYSAQQRAVGNRPSAPSIRSSTAQYASNRSSQQSQNYGCISGCPGTCSNGRCPQSPRSLAGNTALNWRYSRYNQQERNCGGGDQEKGVAPTATEQRPKASNTTTPSPPVTLTQVAHYRPGMLPLPPNHVLKRSGHFGRRSLVRTAAGVTLHECPSSK